MRTALFLLSFLLFTGCKSLGFEPYDYEKAKDAQINLKDFGCSVEIHGKQLRLKKEFGGPEKDDKK